MFPSLPSFCLLWSLITQHIAIQLAVHVLCKSLLTTNVSGSSAKNHTVLVLEMEETPNHRLLPVRQLGKLELRSSALPKVTQQLLADRTSPRMNFGPV